MVFENINEWFNANLFH